MAAAYQHTYDADRPLVIMSPRTRAHLVKSQGTVTARYPAVLHTSYTEPAVQQYIQRRNGWSDATFASINWKAHGKALRNNITLQLHFSKLVHDILPTASHLNTMDKGRHCCPCCSYPKETRDHIICCPHQSCNKWRHTLWTDIYSSIGTDQLPYPSLLDLLFDALRAWMHYDEESEIEFLADYCQYPSDFHLLIRHQNNIGWRQLFHGLCSIEWSRIQGDYFDQTRAESPGQDHKFTGNSSQVKSITLLLKHWRELWLLRSQDFHGHDAATTVLAEKKEVRRRLEQIYDKRFHREPSAQVLLLCLDIQHHLRQPNWVVSNWLSIHTSIFQDSIRCAKTRATCGARSIRTYKTRICVSGSPVPTSVTLSSCG
jgi:hypothetical protein